MQKDQEIKLEEFKKETKTLKQLRDKLSEMIEQNPEYADLPLVEEYDGQYYGYGRYTDVLPGCSFIVEGIGIHWLYLGEKSWDDSKHTVNAICINGVLP